MYLLVFMIKFIGVFVVIFCYVLIKVFLNKWKLIDIKFGLLCRKFLIYIILVIFFLLFFYNFNFKVRFLCYENN